MRTWVLCLGLVGCGGSMELGRPNDPPEWPMGRPGHLVAPVPAAPEEPPAVGADGPPDDGGPATPPEVTEPPPPAPDPTGDPEAP